MKQQFSLYRRDNGRFYLQNMATGKQWSLRTKDENEAKTLLAAKLETAAGLIESLDNQGLPPAV